MEAKIKMEHPSDRNQLGALSIYFCGREQCPSGHNFGPAIRMHYLVHFIYSGKGYYSRNNRTYELTKGDAFLILPGETTYYEADKKDPWEYAWVAFDGYESRGILQSCGLTENNVIFHASNHDLLLNAVTKLVEAFPTSGQSKYLLLGYLFHIFSYMENSSLAPQTFEKEYYLKALHYMQNNYCYDIKINDIAKYVGIDRTYLFKIFKQIESLSPQQYLIAYRLQQSIQLIVDGSLSITEIALSCGFKDSSSFCKHFKEKIGATPKQYQSIIKLSYPKAILQI